MNFILFDGAERNYLLPFTYTRPVAEIRIGILTIKEKWELMLSEKLSYITQHYLTEKFPAYIENENILINGSVLPNEFLTDAILNLSPDEKLVHDDTVIAVYASRNEIDAKTFLESEKKTLNIKSGIVNLKSTWDIFSYNETAIKNDFILLTAGRQSQHIYAPNQLMGLENIFIEEGAKVSASVLNGTYGPIYIGKNAEVMEGCLIRGPLALCEHATLKMGSKIYGATTIGPHCKVGGEVNNSVIFGYSNKAHEGYLGNSVIGEWCNLGADTNTSNLKNNYSNVKVWSIAEAKYVDTGLLFCGLAMGDHSKCSINTQFNTGTVAGISANIFGEGFPSKTISNFSWGGAKGFERFDLLKAIELAERVHTRKHMTFNESDKNILTYLHHLES